MRDIFQHINKRLDEKDKWVSCCAMSCGMRKEGIVHESTLTIFPDEMIIEEHGRQTLYVSQDRDEDNVWNKARALRDFLEGSNVRH